MLCSLYVASQAEVEEFRRNGWVPDDWVLEFGEEKIVDLDKNWQPICDALAIGDDGELARQALLGGEPIGDPDYTGFGPARLIEAARARDLSAVLQSIDAADFRERAGRADLWTNYGVSPDSTADFDYVVRQYLEVRDAYQRAAHHGKSVIVWNF